MIRRLLALLLVLPGVAAADLDPRSADWDGLSRWVGALEATGIRVEAPAAVDLATLPADAGLALLDATAVASPDGLRAFVRGGGRVLLAVEGPEADDLLARFDLRTETPPAAVPLIGGHPALLHLRAEGSGVLQSVRHVVTNHPTALNAARLLPPAINYPGGAPFAFHLRLGAGEIVVLGDASVFINLMLDAGDNARLAANLGDWLGRSGQTPIFLATRATPVTGAPPGADPEAGGGALDGLNQVLADLAGGPAPRDLAIHLVMALLLVATLVYALAVFPGGDARPPTTLPLDAAGAVERAAGRPGGPAAPDQEKRPG